MLLINSKFSNLSTFLRLQNRHILKEGILSGNHTFELLLN